MLFVCTIYLATKSFLYSKIYDFYDFKICFDLRMKKINVNHIILFEGIS